MSAARYPVRSLKINMHTSQEAEQVLSSRQNVVWKCWCRLCAKEDPDNNLNVFYNCGKGKVVDNSLATAIGKYFWVNIQPNDLFPTYLCVECYTLVKSLCSFTDRINRVQSMYSVLQNANSKNPSAAYEVRSSFELMDEEWEHIIKIPLIKGCDNVDIKGGDEIEEDFDGTATASTESEVLEFNEEIEEYSFEFADDAETEVQLSKKKPEESFVEEDEEGGGVDEDEGDNICLEDDEHSIEKELRELYNESTKTDLDDVESQKQIDKECEAESNNADNDEDGEEFNVEDFLKGEHSAQVNEIDSSSRVSKRGHSRLEKRHHKYQCSVCGKKYLNPTPYRKHMRDAHQRSPDIPEFKCDKCDKVLATEYQLWMHRRSHLPLEEKKDTPCLYCDKKFTKVALMQQHIRTVHENMRPYICDECGQELRTLSALTEHKLVHRPERPFQCSVCQKGFKTKARLKVHLETHTETVYVCTVCGLQLNTRRTLKMHMLVHSDNRRYKCDFCLSAFKRAKALKNHLILHTGLRPYKCNFCEKTFSNGSNCRSHKKKMHPEELAREVALGKKTEAVSVPKLEELRLSTNIVENPRKVQRHAGGLSQQMRKILIAAEERAKRGVAERSKSSMDLDVDGDSTDHLVTNKKDVHVETDLDVDIDEAAEEEEEDNETVIYEIIEEI